LTVAERFRIPVIAFAMNHPLTIQLLKDNAIDVLLCCHGTEFFSDALLRTPRRGCINVHPMLFRFKGAHPIQQFIRRRREFLDQQGSVGVHWMTSTVDHGPVITEHFTDLSDCETPEQVYNCLYPLYMAVVVEALERMA